MTTEEKIRLTADKYCLDEYTRLGFVAGAEWADSHPHWIPVEDKLPIDSNNVLCKNARGELYVDSYVRRTMYGDIWRKSEKHPTHWMHLPQPPLVTDLNKKDLPPLSCQKGNILVEEKGGGE